MLCLSQFIFYAMNTKLPKTTETQLENDTDKVNRYRAPALEKGLDILELLAASSEGMTQAEIAKGLDRGANEIYRMLDTLVRRGYIARSNEGDRYFLSLRMLVLANMHPPRQRLMDAAEPRMREFARNTEQSVHLAVIEDGDIVITSAFSAPGNWQLSLRIGAIIGLFNTGSGLVLSAFQSAEIRKQIYDSHRLVPGETALPFDEFSAIGDEIRNLGFYFGASQTAVGVVNLSYPILDHNGHAFAALTCPYLHRINYPSPDQEKVMALLSDMANEIRLQIVGPVMK